MTDEEKDEYDRRPFDPHEIEEIRQIVVSWRRWAWLRSLAGRGVLWFGGAAAAFTAFREEIMNLFSGRGG